jgi:hypothetical protein
MTPSLDLTRAFMRSSGEHTQKKKEKNDKSVQREIHCRFNLTSKIQVRSVEKNVDYLLHVIPKNKTKNELYFL